MPAIKIKLDTLFAGVQAFASVAALLFGLWAFFFSSLSQKLEESLRDDLKLAKVELIEAKEAKGRAENERQELVAATQKLAVAKDRLSAEIAVAQAQLSTLQKDRSKYATSTLSLLKPKFVAMVTYELRFNTKISEICARYDEHRRWLAAEKQISEFEAQGKPVPKGLADLSESQINLWIDVPEKPDLTPNNSPIAISAHLADLLNASGDPKKYHTVVLRWLMGQILDRDGKRAVTGSQFIEHAKRYEFLDDLLPEERDAFNKSIDAFLTKHSEFASKQVNLTTADEPDGDKLIELGKKIFPTAQSFERAFLEHLKIEGIAG